MDKQLENFRDWLDEREARLVIKRGRKKLQELGLNEDEKKEGDITEKIEAIPFEEKLTWNFQISERADDKKRTVVAGVLEGDFTSANGRLYPLKIVLEAQKTLAGKRSMIGHDTDDITDVVAKIVSSRMNGKVLEAVFKFGTDDVSERVFTKIKEGLVDSLSIRANGTTRKAKTGEKFIDVVESLDISSVDWVVEGGISAAHVLQVNENLLKKEPKSEFQLAVHAYKRMAELKTDKERTYVRELIFDEQDNFIEGKNSIQAIDHEVDTFKAVCAALIAEGRKSESDGLVIRPIDRNSYGEQKFSSANALLESRSISDKEKTQFLFEMMGGKNGNFGNEDTELKD